MLKLKMVPMNNYEQGMRKFVFRTLFFSYIHLFTSRHKRNRDTTSPNGFKEVDKTDDDSSANVKSITQSSKFKSTGGAIVDKSKLLLHDSSDEGNILLCHFHFMHFLVSDSDDEDNVNYSNVDVKFSIDFDDAQNELSAQLERTRKLALRTTQMDNDVKMEVDGTSTSQYLTGEQRVSLFVFAIYFIFSCVR
jgi:hypothetical protein